MPADFNTLCSDARAGIRVPIFPLAAIRQAVHERVEPQTGRPRKGMAALLLTGVSVVAVAAAAELWQGAHVAIAPSGSLQLRLSAADDPHFKRHPTARDIEAAASRAHFAVQLPAGLPPGTQPIDLLSSNNLIQVVYALPGAWRRSNHLLAIVLADPRTMSAKPFAHAKHADFELEFGSGGKAGVQWKIGGEIVLIPHSSLTPAELARIKSAMLAQAAAQH